MAKYPSQGNGFDGELLYPASATKYGGVRPTENRLVDCKQGAGNFFIFTSGTLANDTSNIFRGAQSIKLTTPAASGVIHVHRTGISPVVDMTGKVLKVYFKTDDIDNLVEFKIDLSSDGLAASWYRYRPDMDKSYVKDNNTWVCATLSLADAFVTGTPNIAAIDSIRIRIVSTVNIPINVWISGIYYQDTHNEGICSFTFDDGYASVWDKARPKMDQYGYVGTSYINSNKIGSTNRMTTQNIKDLVYIGWDIASHGADHVNLIDVSESSAESLVKECKKFIMQHCPNPGQDHYAFANGGFNESIIKNIIQKYHSSARTIVETGESIPPADYFRLKIVNVTDLDTFSSIQTQITNAIDNKEWLIFCMHDIVDTVVDSSTQISTSLFNQIVDEVKTQGIKVAKVSDVVNGNI